MKNLFLAFALISSPAMAADIFSAPVEKIHPVESYSFSGPYLGLYGGGGAIVNEITFGTFNANGVGGEGIFGGVMGGYNYQVGNSFIVGVQGEVGLGNLETTVTVPGFMLEAYPNWDYSISARAGYPITERALLYGIAGYTYAEYEVEITTGGGAATFTQDYDGYHVGAGIDALMTENLFVGVEYRYTQFGGENWTVTSLDVEPSAHTGRLRAGYKF